jgi:putative DNA primase/helicase
MSTAINYDDVLDQLHAIGLVVDAIETGRMRRCKVEGDRERRGWYALHEIRLEGGDMAIVGAFGVWHGNDNGKQQVELKKLALSTEQKEALRARIREDRKRAEAARRREGEKASARARAMWAKCLPTAQAIGLGIESQYLKDKAVQAHDVRFTSTGTLVIPMCDTAGNVHGLQFIGPEVRLRYKDRNKDFWPKGLTKAGRFHLIGLPGAVLLVAEGYATAASLREATGLAVAVAFDAGNMLPVAEALHKRYPRKCILVCGDDDWLGKCPKCQKLTPTADTTCMHCAADTSALKNAGREAAETAALAVAGAWVLPVFADRGLHKLTDFNDLQHEETPHTVSAQIEAKLAELGWTVEEAPRQPSNPGSGGCAMTPINTTPEVFERFALIYGHNKALFDYQERMLVAIDDMKNACSGREIWRGWMESPEKKIVRIENVGFDPGNADPAITCNLFGGWPVEPKAGACEQMLSILEYLCSNEQNHRDLYNWILKWMAYPLQHPGAKMKTALLVHGPQRVGKNFFFESYMAIFGQYGQVINQDILEDKFNDSFSRKLLLVADEVVARQEMFHVKNKLKGIITSVRIYINGKFTKGYWETNHCNLIFLSNETMPLVLERDDGRFVVLWTPPKLSAEFYKDVEREVDAGGVAALYHYLLNLELGDFGPYTAPPMTAAKRDLMDLSMDSTERFWLEWSREAIQPVPCRPVKSTQLYAFYREWCGRCGYPRYAPEPRFLAEISKRTDAKTLVGRHLNGSGTRQSRFIVPANHAQPPDKTQAAWLSECIKEFTEGIVEWRSEHESQ